MDSYALQFIANDIGNIDFYDGEKGRGVDNGNDGRRVHGGIKNII